MARKKAPKLATVRALRSFDGFRIGETAETELTEYVGGLVAGGFLEVLYGEGEAGPAGADADDPGRGTPGPAAESPAGTEPGPDSGSSGHGPAAQ